MSIAMRFNSCSAALVVPHPDLLVTPLVNDATGGLDLSSTWPAGVPAGLSLCLQAWIVDSVGDAGLSATNGLRATAP